MDIELNNSLDLNLMIKIKIFVYSFIKFFFLEKMASTIGSSRNNLSFQKSDFFLIYFFLFVILIASCIFL